MPVDCGGAALGAVLSELLLLVHTVAITVAAFRPQFKKIESTLKGMDPFIKEFCDFNERLGRLKEMDRIKEVLSEGDRLVSKCKRIRRYNLLKRYKYAKKLTKYDATLAKELLFLLNSQALKDVAKMSTKAKEMLTKAEEIFTKIEKMEEKRENLSSICPGQANGQALQSGLGDLGDLAVPVAPPLTVESDIEASMGENLLPLLEKEVPATDGEIKEEVVIDMPQPLMSDRSTAQNPRNMVDQHQAVTTQGKNGRDHDQWPQNQQQQHLQQGWSDSAVKFHIVFALLKLLTIAYFHSFYTICEVIYLISLVEVTRPVSSNQVYWYSYLIFGTLGFELLLWTNLSLVMWLVINLSSLLVFAAASSHLLMRGFEKRLLQRVPPEIAVNASGGCGETRDAEEVVIDMPQPLMSDRSTAQNPRNMVDQHQAVTTQGKNGRDDDQRPQNQ